MSKTRIILPTENCLILQPIIVQRLGRSPALFLQQLHYWLTSESKIGVTHNGKRWIYNSIKDWANNIKTISEATIKRSITYLRKQNIIFIQSLNPNKAVRTNYYTINYERLDEIIGNEKTEEFKKTENKRIETFYNKKNLKHQIKMTYPLDQNDPIIYKDSENTSENLTNKSDNQKLNLFSQSIENKQYQTKQVEKKTNDLSEEMIKIWTTIVENNKKTLVLNKKRAQYLIAAFKLKFDSSLDKWKHFCWKITQSNFLMGKVKKTFKASLDWVLKFDIIQRIFEGDFGLTETETNINSSEESIKELSEKIQNLPDNKDIKIIKLLLLEKNGVCLYKNWFESIKWEKKENNLILLINDRFRLNYINNNFKNLISVVWKKININGEVILKM